MFLIKGVSDGELGWCLQAVRVQRHADPPAAGPGMSAAGRAKPRQLVLPVLSDQRAGPHRTGPPRRVPVPARRPAGAGGVAGPHGGGAHRRVVDACAVAAVLAVHTQTRTKTKQTHLPGEALFPGDHFYLKGARSDVVRAVRQDLRGAMAKA